ncbi:Ankyrin repeat and SAM domain-containing protein 3 [Phytophthora pseudosyringae]|uniref:Ankyrin repeat and SAM domain-containing protein 3 n=1 Tax=Phytophthora pseudosyringae TaxID=221518 RepID=A0A8T1VSI2_9STRA|nr:Ankyrin repeat and SAM domain-containing protein 3 [Phytophthora pseudosyringae]
MLSPPPLLHVQLALSSELQPLFHAQQLVSDFLIPRTIDGAVYNELLRLKEAYGAFRPWTVGAMDGAATRGRLDIMQKLHSTRAEGCSSRAFVGAAANGHLEVLWWLNEFNASLARPAEMVQSAARNGHARVVKFLWGRLTIDELEAALEAATLNGHAPVVEILRSRVDYLTTASEETSANG